MEEQALLTMKVRCDAEAPRQVRASLNELGQLGDAAEDASLVASELVTNAVLHSGCTERSELTVRVARAGMRLIVAVRDPGCSGRAAHVAPERPLGQGGFGMRIIETLAARWGQARGDGYQVWAELPLSARV